MTTEWQRALPEAQGSTTTTHCQKELWRSKSFTHRYGRLGAQAQYCLVLTARWDDSCGNRSNSFYLHRKLMISGTRIESNDLDISDVPEAITRSIPKKLLALKRWDGCHPFGPWYYAGNAMYLAGDKDSNGLRAGEQSAIRTGKTGKPSYRLAFVDEEGLEVEKPSPYWDGEGTPPPVRSAYIPWMRIGEGKARQFAEARSVAIWPDATEEQLSSPDLEQMLKDRLPSLLREFRADLESVGFVW